MKGGEGGSLDSREKEGPTGINLDYILGNPTIFLVYMVIVGWRVVLTPNFYITLVDGYLMWCNEENDQRLIPLSFHNSLDRLREGGNVMDDGTETIWLQVKTILSADRKDKNLKANITIPFGDSIRP